MKYTFTTGAIPATIDHPDNANASNTMCGLPATTPWTVGGNINHHNGNRRCRMIHSAANAFSIIEPQTTTSSLTSVIGTYIATVGGRPLKLKSVFTP